MDEPTWHCASCTCGDVTAGGGNPAYAWFDELNMIPYIQQNLPGQAAEVP